MQLDKHFRPVSLKELRQRIDDEREAMAERGLTEAQKETRRWKRAKFPSEKSFNGHGKDHAAQFDMTFDEYQQAAADLLAMPKGGKIEGYEKDGRRVRYVEESNIYVVGNAETYRIKTMFKPEQGRAYYERNKAQDLAK